MQFCLLAYNIGRATGINRKFNPERIAKNARCQNGDMLLLQAVQQALSCLRHLDLALYLERQLEQAPEPKG